MSEQEQVVTPEMAEEIVTEVVNDQVVEEEVTEMTEEQLQDLAFSEHLLAVQEKLVEFCKQNDLYYAIAAVQNPTNPGSAQIVSYSKEAEGQNEYVSHNWLWRTAMDISSFARNVVDGISRQFNIINIPAQQLKDLNDEKTSLQDQLKELQPDPEA